MIKALTFLILFFSLNANCQRFDRTGTPKLINYSNQVYGGQRQNWGISESPRSGFLYVANSKGLLEYDGARWQLYNFPKMIRSVLVDNSGRIFTGALGEFGIWKPNKQGELQYHSLREAIQQTAFDQESVWNIIETENGILFQSFAFAYLYTKAGKIEPVSLPGNVNFLSLVNGELFVPVINKGLYQFHKNAFQLISSSQFLAKMAVSSILPSTRSGNILVGTSAGVFEYDGSAFRPLNANLNRFLEENQLNKAIKIGKNRFAFGTILNGIAVTNEDGEIVSIINKNTGLQNNTVLALATDRDGNLWAGLDKGISKIELNSPLSYYSDFEGKLGAIYDVAELNGNFYVGSNRGLFVSPIHMGAFNFNLVSGTQGQVWDLTVIDQQLFCGHNNGTYRITGNQATKISTVTGGWTIKELIKHPGWLIQGTYTKLVFYKKNEKGIWQFHHILPDFSESIKQIEEDPAGNIWINRMNKGLSRLRLSDDFTKIIKQTNFEESPVNSSGVNLSAYDGNILLSDDTKGVLKFNASKQKFEKLPGFELPQVVKLFPFRSPKTFAVTSSDEAFYFSTLSTDPKYIIEEQFVEGFQKIKRVDSLLFFCLEEGFAWISEKELDSKPFKSNLPPLIRGVKVEDFPKLNRLFYQGESPDLTFMYNQNNLTFQFAPANLADNPAYSFWLENYSKTWSKPSKASQKTFYNLPPDTYKLHLRTNRNDTTTTLTFTVQPPWYWNGVSKLLYILGIISLSYLVYRIHLKNLQKHRLEMQEAHNKQVAKKETEITQLRNRQLEAEVKQKSGELANSTMSLIKKNELLTKIKEEVVKVAESNKTTHGSIRSLINLIDKNISTNNDWKVFETNFNEVHETFLNKLTTLYPNLTHGDLKLAAYLRMNLSTKEIAQLLNITNRSVELKRYRLRKKIDIETDENLTDFIMKI